MKKEIQLTHKESHHNIFTNTPKSIFSLAIALMLIRCAESLFVPVLPLYVRILDASIPLFIIGLVTSINRLGAVIVSPGAGGWCDRIGFSKPFMIGVFVVSGASILSGFSQHAIDLGLYRLLSGMQIVSGEDEEVIRGLRALLERSGIEILTEAKVLSTSRKKEGVEVTLEKDGKQERLFSDKVLVAVGRAPCTDGLHLEKTGIQMDGRFIKVNSRMETNVDGVYAIGDVIGKMMLAHAASAEGMVAVENIMGGGREIDYQKIPNCIYTFPEVASVGLKEAEAKRKGYDIRTGKFSYLQSGMALAMGEPEGFVKIIAEKELGQILGVHILGEHATDLIGECLLANKLEAAIEDLGTVVKGHPTLSEAITEAALAWEGLAIHLPK